MEFLKEKHKGFTLIELIIVVSIVGILSSVAIPIFSGFILSARQAAAIAYVDQALKAAKIHWMIEGRWPNSWSEFGENTTSNLKTCSQYGSVCNGNERVIVEGQYLLGFYTRGNELRISAWRFNNSGKTSKNRSVFGCVSTVKSKSIYAWKEPNSFYQGPVWHLNSHPWNRCK